MKIKLLFQGDSITDAGRSYKDPHLLGDGYSKYAAQYIAEAYPQVDFEFINLGIGGNQTKDLVARLQKDFLDVQPDVISIMIGINDVWHYCDSRNWLPDELFEKQYRTVLQALKDQTNAKIMIMEPYLIPEPGKLFFREDLYKKIEIVRKLAREYADVYMPTDGLLCEAYIGDDPLSFGPDGVHLSDKGAQYVGKLYCKYISKILNKMIAEEC